MQKIGKCYHRTVFWIGMLCLIGVSTPDAVNIGHADLVAPSGNDTTVTLAREWRYQPGDDPAWADPQYDDGDWRMIGPLLMSGGFPIDDWTGIGWFRLHLEIDSALWEKPMAINVDQVGAAEIYLDGRLILAQGRVGSTASSESIYIHHFGVPRIFEFEPAGKHVLAVRYSNHQTAEYQMEGRGFGFSIMVGRAESFFTQVFEYYGFAIRHQMFISVMAITFTLLHLLLFIYYPKSRENLYFAILTAGFAGLAYIPTQLGICTSPDMVRLMLGLVKLSLIIVSVFGLRLLLAIFYDHLPRLYWGVPGISVVMLILFWYIPLAYYYYFVILSMVGGIGVTIAAIVRKKKGVVIISIGYSSFALLSSFQMLVELGLLPRITWVHQPYMLGILAMLVSISVYLARDFSRRNLELTARLKQVHELSDRTLKQERQAKEQEVKQKLLEADIAFQTKQLEEAKKLEKALADLERVNYELRTTQSQLVQSEKMASLGQLVAGIAHEINTPIGAAGSMHDTLKRAIDRIHQAIERECDEVECQSKDSIEEMLGVVDEANTVISTAIERVTDIVRRLKSFARLDEADLKTVDIHEGLDDTLVLLHHEMKHGIRVDKNYGQLPKIACYPGQLNQVFLNLLVNAVHAMHGEGEITIITKSDNEKVYIVIVDRGEGIPENQLPRIFDPGFTTKGVGVGTGLGLSICYQIIQDHHGRISATSRLGEGTTFTVVLPTNLEKIIGVS